MERPNLKSVKDPDIISYIEYLEKVTDIITKNSRFRTFVALRKQVDSWVDQITLGATEDLPDPKQEGKTISVQKGYIDLFADKDSKEFDRVWKFIDGADELEDKLQKMKEKLLPAEQEQASKILEGAAAEKYINFDKNK